MPGDTLNTLFTAGSELHADAGGAVSAQLSATGNAGSQGTTSTCGSSAVSPHSRVGLPVAFSIAGFAGQSKIGKGVHPAVRPRNEMFDGERLDGELAAAIPAGVAIGAF
jgi:hypothetical protein